MNLHNTTCAVCMVFVLQYLSTSQLQRKSITPLQCGCKVCRRTWEKLKKISYSRIQLMLKASLSQNKYWVMIRYSLQKYYFFSVLISWGNRCNRRTCTLWHWNDQRKEKIIKKQTNRWATFVPFFTAELGRWRSEETLLRNCKKPWFCV